MKSDQQLSELYQDFMLDVRRQSPEPISTSEIREIFAEKSARDILRPASNDYYAAYLAKALGAGSCIDHLTTYNFSNYDGIKREDKIAALGPKLAEYDFFVATGEGHIDDLYGANSIKIILPSDIELFTTGGHNDVLSMKSPGGSCFNVLYLDTYKEMKKRGCEVTRKNVSERVSDDEWQEFSDTLNGKPWSSEQRLAAMDRRMYSRNHY